MADYRRVSGIDAKGNVHAFTGSILKFWKGKATHFIGKNFAVTGNQLDAETLLKSQNDSLFILLRSEPEIGLPIDLLINAY